MTKTRMRPMMNGLHPTFDADHQAGLFRRMASGGETLNQLHFPPMF